MATRYQLLLSTALLGEIGLLGVVGCGSVTRQPSQGSPGSDTPELQLAGSELLPLERDGNSRQLIRRTLPPIDGPDNTDPAATASPADPADAPPPEPKQLSLRFVGDIIFGRYRETGFSAIASPGFSPFEYVRPLLAADLSVANLETPLLPSLPARMPSSSGYFFAATPSMASQLKDAGFHAVTLSNNHASDMGREGLLQTPLILERLGIMPVGRARPPGQEWRSETFDANGTQIALIGATARRNFAPPRDFPVVPFAPTHELPKRLGALVTSAKRTHDLVVVLLHWGVEYEPRPGHHQRLAAHALIDAGADLVVGHHTHVLSELEVYRGGLIAYSLGNFLFENLNPVPRLTGILGLQLSGPELCSARVEFNPLELKRKPTFHPRPASPEAAKRIQKLLVPRDPEREWQLQDDQLVREYQRCQ